MINAFILFGVGLLSFVGGGAAALLLARARPAAAAASAAPPPQTPASPSLGTAPLEMHLVLNVLNRIVMALGTNEQAQEGVAELADYLRAADEMRRRPSAATTVQQVSSYWRLSRWLHGQPADLLRIDSQAALQGLPAAALAGVCRELTDLIRDLEPTRRADLAAQFSLESAGPGGPRLVVQASATDVDDALQSRLVGPTRAWSLTARRLHRRVELPASG